MSLSKVSPPQPIFDNLDVMENPFHLKSFNSRVFFENRHVPFLENSTVDFEYAWKFMFSYNGSTATFNAYRREIERLLQWAWFIRGASITALKREDIESYLTFCQSPPESWIGTKNVARFKIHQGERRSNPEWRPFVATVGKQERRLGHLPEVEKFTISKAGIQAIFSILSSFYNFLIQEEVCSQNPVSLIRQKSKFLNKQHHKAPVRRISNLQWEYVIETIENLANDNPDKFERALFMLNALFAMYLRISELVADERATPVMGDFRKDIDDNWWFHVTGKGNKSRIIAVSEDMLKALRRYRSWLGLSPLPALVDMNPLVSKTIGKGPVTSTRIIRSMIQECFDLAYQRMKSEGMEEDATELQVATVHWLRHTGISEDVKYRPREHVRDDAGHASMQTTDRYIESDLRERHASGRHKKIKN